MRRKNLVLIVALSVLTMCISGCSLDDEEYVTESEITSEVQEETDETEEIEKTKKKEEANTDDEITGQEKANEMTDSDATVDDTAASDEPEEESTPKAAFPTASKTMDIAPSSYKVTFMGEDIYGNPIDDSILAEYDLTLINIWEPWCGPCVNEMPDFEKAYEDAKASGVKFNIIGFYSTVEDADRVVEALGITYPIVYDWGFFDEYQTGFVPTNFFVNSEGYVLPISTEEIRGIGVFDRGQTTSMSDDVLQQLIANRL